MIKPTKRKKEVVDKIYDITKTYPELFDKYYNADSMELDVDNVPQKLKKVAIGKIESVSELIEEIEEGK